jgi:hypothetical protein
MNRLYFRDNLKWLSDRKEFPDASVDLVYLDPPFNSNADYNVLFREPSGQVSQAISRLHGHVELGWCCRDVSSILTVEGLLNGSERIDAPPQINPFAMAAREQKQHEQAEMLYTGVREFRTWRNVMIATCPLQKQADQAEIRWRTTKKERRVTVPFLLFAWMTISRRHRLSGTSSTMKNRS